MENTFLQLTLDPNRLTKYPTINNYKNISFFNLTVDGHQKYADISNIETYEALPITQIKPELVFQA